MGWARSRFASYAGAVEYLGDEWIKAADQAVSQAASSAPADRLIIDQHIDDQTSYRVVIRQNECSVATLTGDNSSPNADATFSQSLATAAAVAQGHTDAHQAFLLGHIRFEGEVNVLIERREAFQWLQDTLAPVMATTTFAN